MGPDDRPFPETDGIAQGKFQATPYEKEVIESLAQARPNDTDRNTLDRQIVKEGLARNETVGPTVRGPYETVQEMTARIVRENDVNSFKRAVDRLLINDGYRSTKHAIDDIERK